jgi:hypothetical protein
MAAHMIWLDACRRRMPTHLVKVTIVELETKTPQCNIRMLMYVANFSFFPVAVLLHTQV